MGEDLFGLTAEARYYIDKAAEAAAEAAITKLVGQSCPFDCEDVSDLRSTVYGKEGQRGSGLKDRTTSLEEQVGNLVWQTRAAIGASLAAIASLIVAFVKGG